MTYSDYLTQKESDSVQQSLYTSYRYRRDLQNNFEFEWKLRHIFFDLYKENVLSRGDELIVTEKEKETLKYLFLWAISSKEFEGNLRKGIYIAGGQGFGKDIFLKTVVDFFQFFGLQTWKTFTYPDFQKIWYEKDPGYFNSPTRINDITHIGKVKRERESYPFLEFLDYREQHQNTRGILVSSNYTPEYLQATLEADLPVKRLHERIKECFNILIIKEAKTKREEERKVI